MITAWILYAIVVGALLGAGGLALESSLRTHGLPSRWVWVFTILLSIGWPLGHWVLENRPPEPPAAVSLGPPAAFAQELTTAVLPIEPIMVEVPPGSVLRLLDGPITAVWALSTGALLLFAGFLFFRTRHIRARWQRGEAGGHTVLFSDEWGPAVVGFLCPQIVLPGWCREMDEWALRFILAHEQEHIRAGDLRLTIIAGILPVLFPWHLPVWWQLSRLRTAVEGDCDLRVLGRNPGQAKPYVDLLLEVGEWSFRRRPLAAMLSEPYETLKRRIKIMTMPLPKRPWTRGAVLAAGGAVLVAVACLAPGPTDARNEVPASDVAAAPREDATGSQERMTVPVFTPFTVRPAIRNQDEVVASLAGEYQFLLADPSLGGTARVWFFLDEEGRVLRTLVNQSSGYRALDDAAVRIADLIEFTPALNRDQPRSVWVSLPIVFTTSEGDEVGGPERRSGVERGRTAANPPEAATPATQEMGEIAGTARDAQTGDPIPFVQVFVRGTGRGTLTNQDGRFLIQHVPVGEYAVVAILIGYGQVGQAVRVTTEERAEVSYQLQVTAVELDPIVVRGTARSG